MNIKTIKGIRSFGDIFPDLDSFKNYVLNLNHNIHYENELIKTKIKELYGDIKTMEGEISYSLLPNWLIKNYKFKTKKWGLLEYWIERGWSELDARIELEKRNKEIKGRNRLCAEYWINKGYSEVDAKNKIAEIQSKNSKLVKIRNGKSKKMLLEKGYSDEQIKEICLTPSQVKFWINKGYSEDSAKKLVSLNQSRASKFVDYKKRLLPINIQYWINKGYSEEDAKKLVAKRQTTFSFKICVEKYGEDIGKQIFTERQKKWSKSLSTGGKLKIGYSKISQELFYTLLENYIIENRDKIHFGSHNGEFKLEKENGGIWIYDFTDTINKKIIEFNGDVFHGNPNKYTSNDTPNPFRKTITSEEIWEKDKEKIRIANINGYDVLTIWDSDYRWGDKQKIIKKCLDFLSKKK